MRPDDEAGDVKFMHLPLLYDSQGILLGVYIKAFALAEKI